METSLPPIKFKERFNNAYTISNENKNEDIE